MSIAQRLQILAKLNEHSGIVLLLLLSAIHLIAGILLHKMWLQAHRAAWHLVPCCVAGPLTLLNELGNYLVH